MTKEADGVNDEDLPPEGEKRFSSNGVLGERIARLRSTLSVKQINKEEKSAPNRSLPRMVGYLTAEIGTGHSKDFLGRDLPQMGMSGVHSWDSNEGISVTVDSNKNTIDEDPDWNFDVACNFYDIWPCAMDRHRLLHRGDFRSLIPCALSYFFRHTLVLKGGGRGGEDSVKRIGCENQACRFSIHKENYTNRHWSVFLASDDGDDETYDSYHLSDDEDDEPDAYPTAPLDVFQTEMRTSFEQLHITQDIHGTQPAEILEST
ncbi:hypothetical protein M9H77_02760 [Catharanthus roseus]|uniref:Uncharacterized protein n=1 Tax=Catharanthus roseus TaxID=4058 RepID=A0ACC0C9A7_CATRO|nr:hypothetical protein M9H77_02760 [Catharanthus roseus]